MPKYAKRTQVPVSQTRRDLETLVEKYGATSFVTGWNDDGRGMVGFKINGRSVRFLMPSLAEGYGTTSRQREQAHRTAWRALLLLVKAKLEAVESGFTIFDEEFLPHIVTDDGRTVYDRLAEKLPESAERPLLLPSSF